MLFNYKAPQRFPIPVTFTIGEILDMDPSGAASVRELLTYAALESVDKEVVAGMRLEYVEIETMGGWPPDGKYGDGNFEPYAVTVSLHYIEKREAANE
jgi:hypothetical protein